MPNWTTNALLCHAEDASNIVNEKGFVDFNMLIPMPGELLQTSGSITNDAVAYAKGELTDEDIEHYLFKDAATVKGIEGRDDFGWYFTPGAEDIAIRCNTVYIDGRKYAIETVDQFRKLGEIYIENLERYGDMTWYGWSHNHWGTKWNACNSFVDTFGGYALLTFDTAWSSISDELIDLFAKRCKHPFVLECVFEDEPAYVLDRLSGDFVEVDKSSLFFSGEDDEYGWPEVKELSEEEAAEFVG